MNGQEKKELLWDLYQEAVQTPQYSVEVVEAIYRRIFKKPPRLLREDFCGTFAVGREWIKRSPRHRAVGLDLCKEVVSEAVRRNRHELSPAERKRAAVKCNDVRTVTREKSDVVLAENFSFFALKSRAELLDYFKAGYQSLDDNGVFILDLVGGQDFIAAPHEEKEKKHLSSPRPGLPRKFTYIRKQERYDPVTAFGTYSIGFDIGSKRIRNAFTYDWRVWTLPEVRECLLEAGFDEVKVFWDDEKAKLSLREISSIDSKWSLWLCVVAGIKRKQRR